MALSADGNTLAIGGLVPMAQSQGATWVFTRSDSSWSQQAGPLIGTGGSQSAQQGKSVALSDDGNTLAIGAPTEFDQGGTWIFTRSGTSWSQQAGPLVGAVFAPGSASQGESVALSADGNTLAVGGPDYNLDQGGVWIFRRSGTTWSPEPNMPLVNMISAEGQSQGFSVALSADGNTLAAGSITYDPAGIGATFVWIFSGNSWSQQTLSPLVGTGAVAPSFQGFSVALSDDGDTLAVGGSLDKDGVGATWIFTRSGSSWSQQGEGLIGAGVAKAFQGFSVSLSADGNTLAVGGPGYQIGGTPKIGAAWIFTRVGTTWTQSGPRLVGADESGLSGQGFSVALSGDGNTLASGGINDNSQTGATWVFAR